MLSLIQKFKTTQPNECILHTPEVLEAIKESFGKNTYNDLKNNQSTIIEISAILCDSSTKIEVRYNFNEQATQQNLIEDCVFTYPRNNIASVISTNPISGTIYLTVE